MVKRSFWRPTLRRAVGQLFACVELRDDTTLHLADLECKLGPRTRVVAFARLMPAPA